MNTVVGIDLGTTYSAIAYINKHGKPEIMANREGERITPSVVLFDDDTPIVGTIAKRSAASNPLNYCHLVKRQMGEKDWKFLAENDKEYTPEQISALIIRRLKEDAETVLDCEITDAVITVPAYFNDAQRKATQDAGRIAGLNVLRIVNEPTAAALAYGLDQVEGETIMVYDLGGGTFDITIIKISKGEIEVIATGGDKNLGGFDWDNKIIEFLNEKFKEEGGTDLTEDPALLQDLRDKAEIAKKTLSTRENTKVFLSASGKNISVSISRDDFEKITADLLNRTESLMVMTLEDAKMNWTDIDKTLLVGGSTRMTCIPKLIENVTGKKASVELHPDEVVATGAAMLAGILQKERGQGDLTHLDGLPDMKISDVNSHSLGVVAIDSRTGNSYNSIILQKNTAIQTPISKVYGTIIDDQELIEVQVTEGEEEDLEYVRIVGGGTIDIPPYSKGASVEVTFKYDQNGIIHVNVFDMTAKKQLKELHIKRESNRTEAEVDAMERQLEKVDLQ